MKKPPCPTFKGQLLWSNFLEVRRYSKITYVQKKTLPLQIGDELKHTSLHNSSSYQSFDWQSLLQDSLLLMRTSGPCSWLDILNTECVGECSSPIYWQRGKFGQPCIKGYSMSWIQIMQTILWSIYLIYYWFGKCNLCVTSRYILNKEGRKSEKIYYHVPCFLQDRINRIHVITSRCPSWDSKVWDSGEAKIIAFHQFIW